MIDRINYIKTNWKLLIHLMFSTYYFGVNNKWKSDFPSIFGVPVYKRTPKKILQNYHGAKFRVLHCYFIDTPNARIIFPKHFKTKLNKSGVV
jgi:hypothetical protein